MEFLMALFNYVQCLVSCVWCTNVWYHVTGVFCVLVFTAALLHTLRLRRRLQYQFTRSWWDP